MYRIGCRQRPVCQPRKPAVYDHSNNPPRSPTYTWFGSCLKSRIHDDFQVPSMRYRDQTEIAMWPSFTTMCDLDIIAYLQKGGTRLTAPHLIWTASCSLAHRPMEFLIVQDRVWPQFSQLIRGWKSGEKVNIPFTWIQLSRDPETKMELSLVDKIKLAKSYQPYTGDESSTKGTQMGGQEIILSCAYIFGCCNSNSVLT